MHTPDATRRGLMLASLHTGLLGTAWAVPAGPQASTAGEAMVSDVKPGPNAAVAALLRAGGVVLVVRHALAPGTFDPPEFRLGDCRTQRNLNDEGRAQAQRLGQWFRDQKLEPAAVRSSPWCRCQDTATLAFDAGTTQTWAALGSPRGSDAAVNRTRLGDLQRALAALPAGRFEVWVTHNFVISDLAATGSDSGEGLVLRARRGGGTAEVLARLAVA